MSDPNSPTKAASELGINFDDEYDDDEIIERRLKEREADVKSITSTFISPEEAINGSIDQKLLSVLTNRSYDAIVKSAQDRATKDYLSNLTSEMNFLLQNHLSIQKEFGTANDDENNWKIDLDSTSDEDLNREIGRLRKKLDRIRQENSDLEAEKEKTQEKLEIIYSQNEKLERLIPME
ncbi:hypothetical protein TRFO_39327 [Tritrichomonas foetus]|uniref:Uncharacterized protein n=1 Tax=Tritrichomonas foetus TaxID=1144522 RepID=A0A1J4J778_9EUKA|nr:hypothetical protein TRFO_39327 [Tritrichomonas foetus]|eukprot:OHS94513.1 hypothetical protein TRFO_39327 [Tritrichomonas foetus]